MADKRISQLIERVDIANDDVLPIVASGATTTNKVTVSTLQDWMQENLDVGVTSVGITIGSTGTDVNVTGSPITSSGNITINIPTASATNRGLLSAADWSTFNSKQGAITLTTTGTSGVSTLVGNTLNIPNYTTDLSGYVTLGTAQTITAQKTFTTSGSSDTMIISHGSGSGFALDVLKAGNGEAIRVTKTSGSGNAVTISGGNFEAGTIVKTGGTSSQFLKADGSIDSSTYLTTGSAGSTYVPYSGAAANVNLGVYTLTASAINSSGGGSVAGQINLRSDAFFNLVNGYGTIGSGTGNTFNFYQTTNTGDFRGATISLNSIPVSTTRQYTLPNADGTLALSSDLGSYLPLTGGTLTGALNGTSAVFSGNVTISKSSPTLTLNAPTGTAGEYRLSNSVGTSLWSMFSVTGGGDSQGNFGLYSLGKTGGAGAVLEITPTGAATFSSSVTAQGFQMNGTGGYGVLARANGINSAGNGAYIGFVNNDFNRYFISQLDTNNDINYYYYNGSTWSSSLIKFTNTGAATFSSSVTAKGILTIGESLVENGIINSPEGIYINADSDASGGTNDIVFGKGRTSTSGGTTFMTIKNAGNVGIGTALPTSPLHVGTTTGGNQKLQHWGEPGFIDSFGLILRGSSEDGVFKFYGLNGGSETANPILSMNRSNGNVGIGTASPETNLTIEGTNRAFPLSYNTGYGNLHIQSNETTATQNFGGSLTFGGLGRTSGSTEKFAFAAIAGRKETTTSGDPKGYLQFGTLYDDTNYINERMRITSAGYLKASNTGTYANVNGNYHEIRSNQATNAIIISNTNASPYIANFSMSGTPNNDSIHFLYCEDSTAKRINLLSNGGIQNYQANNLNLSDERTKKDIEPLESYWDKFKAIEIVKFKYKDQTHDDFNIGVIAQQVEEVAPEFVDVDGWDTKPKLDEEGNEIKSEEEPLKSIYTADLYHATIKVLQEAMAKIEKLETEIDSLKNQMQ